MQHRLVKLLGVPAPWLMGVVNVTPDSFSDGGRHLDPDAAVAHGRQLLADGAHVLDLGGESTAPGSRPITGEQELARLEPVVRALAARGHPLDRHLPCRDRGALHPARGPDRQRRLGPAGRPGHGGCGPRSRAGAGDDARQGRALAARDRPPGPLCRPDPRRRRLASRPCRCCAGRGDRRRPDRPRSRLGQVSEPGARAQLGAAGPLRRAGRASRARSRCWSGSRARAFSACRSPSATRSRS